jgi:hypothetical protein
MKMRGLRNWLMLKGLSFSSPAKILLSKLVRRGLFCHGAQMLGHSYFKHVEACSKRTSISDNTSCSKL